MAIVATSRVISCIMYHHSVLQCRKDKDSELVNDQNLLAEHTRTGGRLRLATSDGDDFEKRYLRHFSLAQ